MRKEFKRLRWRGKTRRRDKLREGTRGIEEKRKKDRRREEGGEGKGVKSSVADPVHFFRIRIRGSGYKNTVPDPT